MGPDPEHPAPDHEPMVARARCVESWVLAHAAEVDLRSRGWQLVGHGPPTQWDEQGACWVVKLAPRSQVFRPTREVFATFCGCVWAHAPHSGDQRLLCSYVAWCGWYYLATSDNVSDNAA